jgi:cell division protein FtsW
MFMGLLMLLGLIVMYAIGPERANLLNRIHNTNFYTENYFVIKQVVSLTVALSAFFVMSAVPFTTLRRYGWRLVQVGFALSALLFLFGNVLHVIPSTLGAYRWFYLGPLGSFQPAEVLKLALLVYAAGFLGKRYAEGRINDKEATVYPIMALSGLALFIVIVLQKDMGTGLAMASMLATMLIVSTMNWKLLGKIALVCVALGVLAIVTAPHRMERLTTFFSGDHASTSSAEEADNNYHIKNAMIALGTGGFFGRGIGRSIQATGYLPEAINDSIFAIMGEIFGFVGTAIIVGLFAALLLRLLKISDHLTDMSMRLAVAGVFGWLAAHVIMNIASMIGLVPLTGITLPLLSFGGTSMIFMCAALGLAFQLSRYTNHGPVQLKEEARESTSSRRGIGGSRYTRRRRVTGN